MHSQEQEVKTKFGFTEENRQIVVKKISAITQSNLTKTTTTRKFFSSAPIQRYLLNNPDKLTPELRVASII